MNTRKALLIVLGVCLAISLAHAVNLNRITRGIQVTGGTNSTSGVTLVTSDSNTNEFSVVRATIGVSNQPSATVTYAVAFTESPTVVMMPRAGITPSTETIAISTPTVTGFTVTNLPSATTTVAPVRFLIYGTQRSGVYQ